jgi:catechol 2,3-dioxygenase-like lactoylglutathione lyase family enzyme
VLVFQGAGGLLAKPFIPTIGETPFGNEDPDGLPQPALNEAAPMSISLPAPTVNRTPDGATAVVKFHASLNVSDLARSVEFYRALLGTEPAKRYADYAKFEVETPPLVLSLKPKRACVGGPLNHLGMRLINLDQLWAIRDRLKAVGARVGEQDQVECCYARQTKLWVTDPDGTLWEVYVLHDDVPAWGEKHRKVKLLAAPFKALGFCGLLCRAWNNAFGRRAKSELSGPLEEAAATATPSNRS